MRIYTKSRLEKFLNSKKEIMKSQGVVKSRFCKNGIMSFLQNDSDKICGLYGLRRTGKSTLMYQVIEDLGIDNVAYINCSKSDDFIDLERELDSLSEKYIFIDEITKIEDFIKLSSSLSENYPDKKIVITGTDSAALLFAKGTELYNRINFIHTTYISFAEYNNLLGRSLEDYVRFGGTLTDGKTVYNTGEDLEEYTNTAIISNICKCVQFGEDDTSYSRLYALYLNGSLEAAINKTIEIRAKEFSTKVMRSVYNKSHTLGSTKDLMLRDRSNLSEEDVDTIRKWKDYSEICEYIEKHINLQDSSNIKETDIELITNFLIKLDVLTKVSNDEICFTQPGMQYCFSEVLIDEIVNTSQYQSLYPNTQQSMMRKIHEDAVGHILENIIMTDVHKHSDFAGMQIGKLENTGNGEFDLYIVDSSTNMATVYEIKHSSKIVEAQYQHLVNDSFCNEFEAAYGCHIVEKAVIYQGESTELSNGIKYYNAEEFLLNLHKIKSIFEKEYKKTLAGVGKQKIVPSDIQEIATEAEQSLSTDRKRNSPLDD